MALFSLPLAPSATTHHSKPLSVQRREESVKKTRKRKRTDGSTSSDSDNQVEEQNTLDPSTNPLSLSQDEIGQYKLAGLKLNEKSPDVAGWPHRGFSEPTFVPLKTDRASGKGKAEGRNSHQDKESLEGGLEELENDKRAQRGAQLRLQHVGVLTTILHKCLLKGDIMRARRAWAMLLRMQVSGQGIDIRSSGYWGIGAELLIRSPRSYIESEDDGFTSEHERDHDQDSNEDSSHIVREKSKERDIIDGLRKARDYYERLIIEHPYKRQFSGSINALNWWPVMIGCEIYGIQYEQTRALRDLEKKRTIDEFQDENSDIESNDDRDNSMIEESDAIEIQGEQNSYCPKKKEVEWQARDQIRQTALVAAENVAIRLDERMIIPPYSDNCDMLRLRGMLALYIGDLHVPPKPSTEGSDISEEDKLGRDDSLTETSEEIQRRILNDKRIMEYEAGLTKRTQEIRKAKSFFEKVLEEGGDITQVKEHLEIREDLVVRDYNDDDE